ncbi:hypothetical protein EDC39_11041 [Geothermobacter ehrlichii]|uniref:Putative nickel insertion protein n=1 Tax=Geothermobacter ehrlichii TaxID=213224 RepID=A0A5D3WGD9_9BACT|nr:nickel pincer cofactor biosynthesis protein LarC [Geothermobacter ehrlichii]TYO97501.1 hypothetical protein EDC39_11041 [Geothermobacter ehrlichii]
MKTLYLDTFSGIAGDMLLGLMVDLGFEADRLRGDLAALGLDGWTLHVRREKRLGIGGTRVEVRVEKEQPHRSWNRIDRMLADAPLPAAARKQARTIFRLLGETEAKIHGVPLDAIHFHEVGAVDAIIDIVGCCLALQQLGIERLVCSPLPLSRGFVDTEHGRMPLPAPATAALLENVPVVAADCDHELVTPTGAAIVKALAEFAPLPAMRLERTGYGVGGRELADRPNLLRGLLGEETSSGLECDRVTVIESHIDDASPEWLGYLQELLFEHGALDVAFAPLQMKKNRPGAGIILVAPEAEGERLAALLLRQGTSSGVRWRTERRWKLPREIRTVATPFGEVRVKLFQVDRTTRRLSPEFEDCRRIARQTGLPLAEVYRQVECAAEKLLAGEETDT